MRLVAGLVSPAAFDCLRHVPRNRMPADRQITLAVSMLMERQHLTGQRLDDTISERCLKTFIKDLDPLKLFFYQSDVDEFSKNKQHLDDTIQARRHPLSPTRCSRGSCRASTNGSRWPQAELNKPQDFTVDEEMIRDPDAATFAKTPEEAAERWRQRVKFDLMKETADKVPMDEAVKKLTKRYDSIRKSWQQTDNDELLERYLSAMTSAFDPHSSYMAPSTLDNFNIQMKLELDGIGASLRGVDGYTVVQNVIPGGAADKNGGLKPEDKIVGVGEGTSGPMEDIVDMKLNDVVKKIRGKRGTIVRLEVEPKDGGEPQDDRHHPRSHRAQGQRSPQRDHRTRQEGRWHAVPHRRDPAAQLLHGHGRRSPGPAGLQEHDPRRAPLARRVQDRRTSMQSLSTCAGTAAAR